MYVCMYVYIYTRKKFVDVCIYMSKYEETCIYIYTYIHTYTYMCICIMKKSTNPFLFKAHDMIEPLTPRENGGQRFERCIRAEDPKTKDQQGPEVTT